MKGEGIYKGAWKLSLSLVKVCWRRLSNKRHPECGYEAIKLDFQYETSSQKFPEQNRYSTSYQEEPYPHYQGFSEPPRFQHTPVIDNSILGSGNFEILKGGTFYDKNDYRQYRCWRELQLYLTFLLSVTTHGLRVTGTDKTTSSTISETLPTSRRRTRDQEEDITAITSGGNVQYDCLSGTAVQSIRAKSGVTRWQKVKAALGGRERPLPGGRLSSYLTAGHPPWGCSFIGHWCKYHWAPLSGSAQRPWQFPEDQEPQKSYKTPRVTFQFLKWESGNLMLVTTKPSLIFHNYVLLLRPYLLSYNKVCNSLRFLFLSLHFLKQENILEHENQSANENCKHNRKTNQLFYFFLRLLTRCVSLCKKIVNSIKMFKS